MLENYRLIGIDSPPAPAGSSLPNKFWPFIAHYWGQAWAPVLLLLVVEALSVMLNTLPPLFYREMIDSVNAATPDWQHITTLFITLVGVCYLLQPLVARTGGYLGWPMFFVHFRERVRYQMAATARQQSIAYFSDDFAGRISNKIREGGYAVTELLSISVYSIWGLIINWLTVAFLLATTNLWLALAFTGWVACFVLYLVVCVPPLKKRSKISADEHSKTSGALVDSLSNIVLVKLFGQEKAEDTYLRGYQNKSAVASMRVHLNLQHLWTGMHVMAFLLCVPVIGLTLYGRYHGWLSTGDVVMVFVLLPQVFGYAWWAMESATSIVDLVGVIDDTRETLAKPITLVDVPNAQPLKVLAGQGSILFDQVSFHYGKPSGVMDNFTLHIPAGQKVGLVGPSGAGKSTVVNLLLRFYDPVKGEVSIAGQNIRQCAQTSVRRAIGVVRQESDLFHRTVRENIAYGKPDATQTEIEAAAKAAHAHDFILTLRDKDGRTGYDALVGERGVKLSGGQRQRIAIARVILENAPILVLDEATSALDSEVEAAIQAEMEALMAGKTVLAIAHRLSTIAKMDRLVVMHQGQIVEEGTHIELLNRKGRYADLWNRQTGGYLPEN